MSKPSLTDRLRYAFDNTMSRGPIALIGWLVLAVAIVIFAVSLLLWLTGIASEGSLLVLFCSRWIWRSSGLAAGFGNPAGANEPATPKRGLPKFKAEYKLLLDGVSAETAKRVIQVFFAPAPPVLRRCGSRHNSAWAVTPQQVMEYHR
jgi:hypothetical protein